VGNLILNIHTTFLSDDVIIVTSSDRTQSICDAVYYFLHQFTMATHKW